MNNANVSLAEPATLGADEAYAPLGVQCSFDAAPYKPVHLLVEADAEGDAGCVRLGLALDGATTAPPHDGDFTIVVAPGTHAHTLVTLMPHPHDPTRPFWLAPDAEWPGPVPVGHVAPGAHRVTLWARAEGGAARLVAASVTEVAIETRPESNAIKLVVR